MIFGCCHAHIYSEYGSIGELEGCGFKDNEGSMMECDEIEGSMMEDEEFGGNPLVLDKVISVSQGGK